MGATKIEITHVEAQIENEINQGMTQRDVSQSYALALRSSYKTDWERVNKAIIAKWGTKALQRIKTMAWKGTCFPKELR